MISRTEPDEKDVFANKGKRLRRIRSIRRNFGPPINSALASGRQDLSPLCSRLPLAFYLLSFALPFRSRFSDPAWRDTMSHSYALYAVGLFAAVLAGAGMPALNLLSAYWYNGMLAEGTTPNELKGRGAQVAWIYAITAVFMGVSHFAFLAFCEHFRLASSSYAYILALEVCAASQTLTARLRHVDFASVLVQDAAFFDNVGPGEVSTRASKDIETIRTAFGEKLGYVISTFATVLVVGTPNHCRDRR